MRVYQSLQISSIIDKLIIIYRRQFDFLRYKRASSFIKRCNQTPQLRIVRVIQQLAVRILK